VIELEKIVSPTTHLLRVPEVAAELGVCESTVQNWIYAKAPKKPALESFVKGGVRMVSLEALTRFVLLNSVKPGRPDWLTAAVESDFRQIIRMEVQAALMEMQRKAA
jgi:hypothetical protein